VNFRSTGDVSGTTRYYWNPSFASPDSTKGAGGDVTYVGYNSDGTVSYIQPGTDIARRTNVAYYSSGGLAGLYRASSVPGRTERDSVAYDASSGNPRAVWTRKGDSSYTHRDAFGRVTYAASQVKAGVWRGDSTEYDLADNVTWQRSYGPPVSYTLHSASGSYLSPVPADTLVVHNSYDAEGNISDVSRWAAPNRTGAPTATNSYLYDGLGRKTSETSSVGADLTLTYDPAGNLIQSQGFTGITSMQYDPLGRLTQRIAEQQSYLRTTCNDFKPWGAGIGCNFSFPLSTTGSLTIPADTATFVYDAAGNTVRADNGSARIRRSYSPSGLVLTDTLRTRVLRYATNSNITVAQDFASHVYGIRVDYDKAGRRSGLWHPTNLAPCGVSCPAQLYAYDTLMNRLTSATDIRGVSVSFQYNTAGQLTDVLFPGSISEHSDYDAEGLPTRRWVGTSTSKYINDTLTYDPAGRVIEAHGRVVRDGQSQDLYNVYSGLGALAEAEHDFSAQTAQLEEFRSDALGNQIESRRSHVRLSQAGDEPAIRISVYDTTSGFLMHVTSPPDSLEWQEFTHTWSDINGRTEREGGMLGGNSHPGGTDIWQSAHYYDGNGKLALFEKHIGDLQQASLSNDPRAVSETYRYDAFGRRVLVRSLHDASCTVAGCESTIQRFVWDGDQLLYETRGQADSAAADWIIENDNPSGVGQYNAPNAYGVVGYIHVGGIDRPLEVMRRNTTASSLVSFFPQANWRGLYETGTKDDGSLVTNSINWPGANASAYLGASAPTSPYEWFGSVIAEQADASGLMYRRNRYYNPQTGRFTQEDPIGLAGGLNLYGFAGGDPVNFSDPFGLYIEPIQDARLRAVLAKMLESPTFKKIWLAMALAPKDQATYRFDITDFNGVMKFSGGQSGAGHTICGMHACHTMINGDNIDVTVATDEFVHGAAGADRGIAKKAGVPGACSTHMPGYSEAGCNDIRDKIENETAAANKEKPKPEDR
jgi:RHS repeat-associated protein